MGTFNYPSPANDVKFDLAVPDQLKAGIFQFTYFRTSCFNDPWILTSPLTSMEGVGNLGMDMPLSVAEVAYIIVQRASTNPYSTSPHELDLVLDPIWAQESSATYDPLDLLFPSDEVILEEIIGPDRPWDDLHHVYYFLHKMKRIEAGEFITTVNGDAPCYFNPLSMHKIYVEGNMASIAKSIPIYISRTPGFVENIFVGVDCSPKEIQIYIELIKEFHDIFA
jgi:hypothetical protein